MEPSTPKIKHLPEETNTHLSALVHLAGSNYKAYDANELFNQILTSILTSIQNCKSKRRLQLRGRTKDLLRINYDPSSEHFTGIKARMTSTISVSESIDYEELDTLLCPLLSTNHKAFDIERSTLRTNRQLTERDGYNGWVWGMKGIKNFKHTSWEKRDRTIDGVLGVVRERCIKCHPTSDLLKNPKIFNRFGSEGGLRRVLEWSLYSRDVGLGVKLRSCFQDAGLGPDGYYDLIERELYLYKRDNPQEMYGNDSGSFPGAGGDGGVDAGIEQDEDTEEDDGGVRIDA